MKILVIVAFLYSCLIFIDLDTSTKNNKEATTPKVEEHSNTEEFGNLERLPKPFSIEESPPIEKESPINEEVKNPKNDITESTTNDGVSEQKPKVESKKPEPKKVEKTESRKIITVEATAYTAKCEGCIGITKTGVDVRDRVLYDGMRIIAVDPNLIPLHSIVRIEYGDKSFKAIALDTGGAIENKRIDILMKTRDRALNFGRRDVEVTILKKGSGQ